MVKNHFFPNPICFNCQKVLHFDADLWLYVCDTENCPGSKDYIIDQLKKDRATISTPNGTFGFKESEPDDASK